MPQEIHGKNRKSWCEENELGNLPDGKQSERNMKEYYIPGSNQNGKMPEYYIPGNNCNRNILENVPGNNQKGTLYSRKQ